MIDAIITRHPHMTREDLEEDFRLWNFEEYARLRDSGLLDPLIRAQEGDDDLTRAERVEDFLKELRMSESTVGTLLYLLTQPMRASIARGRLGYLYRLGTNGIYLIVYHGIHPELTSGIGHEALRIANLRARVRAARERKYRVGERSLECSDPVGQPGSGVRSPARRRARPN